MLQFLNFCHYFFLGTLLLVEIIQFILLYLFPFLFLFRNFRFRCGVYLFQSLPYFQNFRIIRNALLLASEVNRFFQWLLFKRNLLFGWIIVIFVGNTFCLIGWLILKFVLSFLLRLVRDIWTELPWILSLNRFLSQFFLLSLYVRERFLI